MTPLVFPVILYDIISNVSAPFCLLWLNLSLQVSYPFSSLLFYHEIHSQKRKFSINFSRAKPCNFFSFPVILNEDTTGGQRL